MRRFILTGAPGAGKTAILRQLELDGFSVVEEAATDVIALEQAKGIAEPWARPVFIDAVVDLQRRRRLRAMQDKADVQFHDRSAFCTAALATFLGHALSETLRRELERLNGDRTFERHVFFVRNLGFVTPTEARRISLEEALRFEQVHEETYRRHGFELVSIEPGDLAARVGAVRRAI